MTITTYGELLAATKRWAQNTELEDIAYQDFVLLTEAHLNAELRVQDMSERLEMTTTAGQPLYSLPSDARGIRNIEIDDAGRRYPLIRHTPETLDAEYGWITRGAVPEAFTLTGFDVEVRPTPNGEYPLRFIYYKAIPALSQTNQSNWVLVKYPNMYLYGCLHFLGMYVRDDEVASFWGSRLGAALGAATEADAQDRWSGGTPVMRAV